MVILTALPLEYQALRAHLTELEERIHPEGTIFEVGLLPGSPWKVALAEIGQGARSAAVITERAHTWLQPEALLFVGVAGGLADDIALGDVVVATKVYGYHGGKQTPEGFHARPQAWDASHRLEQAARAALRDPQWGRRLAGPIPAVHFKPIAAGEIVLNDAQSSLTDQLTRQYNDAVAIEMESSGVAQAAHLTDALQTLTVRGISDKADGRKRTTDADGWQQLAAGHAAAAALAVLDRLVSVQPAPPPPYPTLHAVQTAVPYTPPAAPPYPVWMPEDVERRLAKARDVIGNVAEKARLMSEVFPDAETVWGADSWKYLKLRWDWAELVFASGRVAEAADEYLDLMPRMVGTPEANPRGALPDMLFRLSAHILVKAGRVGEAVELLSDQLDASLEVKGPRAEETLRLRESRALAIAADGDPDEAVRLLKELIPDIRDAVKAMSSGGDTALQTRFHLGVCLLQAQRRDEALMTLGAVLRDRETSYNYVYLPDFMLAEAQDLVSELDPPPPPSERRGFFRRR
ncbi:hypothetical protein OG607_08320 [Streptomyces sp. NBC_01537]|uniref:5'-methylthioadenosine/S-adenosylhomocysteine nucleosidase family protein n=1 Tax=Streptomyces sp. NBC_01537 TaxID=2903896 RepID=UPI0038655449